MEKEKTLETLHNLAEQGYGDDTIWEVIDRPENDTTKREPVCAAWIPVEERLPEIGQAVLASKNNNCVFITEYLGGWNFRHAPRVYEISKVDAWMPLPEAYVVDPKQQID